MSDETYSRVQAERELLSLVDADPRVVAALTAKNAFIDSDAGKHLDDAVHARETWTLVDEDLKDLLEAHMYNYARTRRLVKAELRAKMEAGE
jgi:hypothetical protein